MADPVLSTSEPNMVEPYLLGTLDYSPEEFRTLVDAVWRTGGVASRLAGHLKVVQTGSGSNTTVTVNPGFAIIEGTEDATNQGKYLVKLRAPIEVPIDPAPSTGSAVNYNVIAYVEDAGESGATNLWGLKCVTTADTTDNALVIGKFSRSVGVANVVNSAIIDARYQAVLTGGHARIGHAIWSSGSDVNTVSATDVLIGGLQVSGLTLVEGRTYKASFLVHHGSGNTTPTDEEGGVYTLKVGGGGSAFDTAKGKVEAFQYISNGGAAFENSTYASVIWEQAATAYNQFVSLTVHRSTGNNTWYTTPGNGSHLEVTDIT